MIIDALDQLAKPLAFIALALCAGTLSALADPPTVTEASPSATAVVLEGVSNRVSLVFTLNSRNDYGLAAGSFLIRAGGEPLFQSYYPPQAMSSGTNGVDLLTLNGQGLTGKASASLRMLERCSGAEWEYLCVDLAPAFAGQVERFERRALVVGTDLVVIMDRVKALQPAEFRFAVASPPAWEVDALWGDLKYESAQGGLTVHLLTRPQQALGDWKASNRDPDFQVLSSGVSLRFQELTAFAVFLVRPAHCPVSLAFKTLESPDAIGVRIHRDGLPTLIGFRKDEQAATATLAGLSFAGPVGLDVYRPKSRQR